MPQRVFILRSRLGRSVFVLQDDSLEITSYLFGRKREARIPISTISSEYEVRGPRALRTVTLLLVPVALCVIAYRWLLHHPELPDFLLHYPVYVGAIFALAALRFFPRFEVFVFKNHFHRPVFTIMREPGQRAECEAFIHDLLDRIEHSETGAAPTVPALSDEEIAKADDQDIPRWKLALGLSLVSAIVPPIVNWLWPDWNDASILLIMVCSGGAFVAALYSFAQKEAHKRWSLLAVAIAIVPIAFY